MSNVMRRRLHLKALSEHLASHCAEILSLRHFQPKQRRMKIVRDEKKEGTTMNESHANIAEKHSGYRPHYR